MLFNLLYILVLFCISFSSIIFKTLNVIQLQLKVVLACLEVCKICSKSFVVSYGFGFLCDRAALLVVSG